MSELQNTGQGNKSAQAPCYMQAVGLIRKTREYLDYVEEHVLNVQRAWGEVQAKCKDMRFVYDDFVYNCLDMEVQMHDTTKLHPEELVQYRRQFYPLNDREKGAGFKEAWEHHKLFNPHHWETWTKEKYTDPYEWEIHCAHMVIDWMAMGYKFGDTAQEYYENNKEKIHIPDYAEDFIYEIFKRLYNSRDRHHEAALDDTGQEGSACCPGGNFQRRKPRETTDLSR